MVKKKKLGWEDFKGWTSIAVQLARVAVDLIKIFHGR
jgi:hypothetical protein